MRTIVDRTTAAMGVEVCSFYLADRDRTRLTLAATNGLDRTQVGRVSLAFGEGITGRVAAGRQPIAVPDVTPRSALLVGPRVRHRGAPRDVVRAARLARERGWASLNVQATERARVPPGRDRVPADDRGLLAGIVEKGRLTAEVEARLVQLTALDAARAELLSVVTHELRTPLSVVRVYVDLLAEAAQAGRTDGAGEWRDAASDQLARLDRQVDSILASVRGEGLTGLSRAPFDAVASVGETVETLRLLLRPHPIRWDPPSRAADRDRRRGALPPGARAAAGERIQVRANGRRASASAPGSSATRSRSTSRTTVRASRSRTGRASSSRSSGSTAAVGVAVPGSGCLPLVG